MCLKRYISFQQKCEYSTILLNYIMPAPGPAANGSSFIAKKILENHSSAISSRSYERPQAFSIQSVSKLVSPLYIQSSIVSRPSMPRSNRLIRIAPE